MSLESLPATPAASGQSLLAAPEAAAYSADALLRDGTSVHVRAIHPDDKERLRDHFHGLSPESVYNRFFGMKTVSYTHLTLPTKA